MSLATAAIVLAAGEGTRIKATRQLNKVAFPLGGRPMILYPVHHLKSAKISPIVVVVGFAATSVKQALGQSVHYAWQRQRLGTGHAVKVGLKLIHPQVTTVLTMYGDDSAFYPPPLFHSLLKHHRQHQADISLLTVVVPDPTGLGRIIRSAAGQLLAIVEHKHATPAQRQIKEINTGLFCFDVKFLHQNLPRLHKNLSGGEYYLTDLVAAAVSQHLVVVPFTWPDAQVWQGLNTQVEYQRLLSRSIPPVKPV